MSNVVERLVTQARRDAQRAKAKRRWEMQKRHELFGLEFRAKVMEVRHGR